MELIYTGREDQALKLFDLAWPVGVDGKQEALQKFVEAVSASDYWKQMGAAQDEIAE